MEETNLDVKVVKFLYEEPYEYGISYCFLAVMESEAEVKLGCDPEEKEVDFAHAILQGVDWHTLESMKNDLQVSKVIALLDLSNVNDKSGQSRSN